MSVIDDWSLGWYWTWKSLISTLSDESIKGTVETIALGDFKSGSNSLGLNDCSNSLIGNTSFVVGWDVTTTGGLLVFYSKDGLVFVISLFNHHMRKLT